MIIINSGDSPFDYKVGPSGGVVAAEGTLEPGETKSVSIDAQKAYFVLNSGDDFVNPASTLNLSIKQG